MKTVGFGPFGSCAALVASAPRVCSGHVSNARFGAIELLSPRSPDWGGPASSRQPGTCAWRPKITPAGTQRPSSRVSGEEAWPGSVVGPLWRAGALDGRRVRPGELDRYLVV